MPTRTDRTAPSTNEVPATPKTFSPQLRGAGGAWDSFRNLTKGEATRIGADDLVGIARSNFRARRIRSKHLPDTMFGEPAWDMLLALYIRSRSGARQTVSSLSKYSASPPTTALRWIDYLEKAAFVSRRASPTDKRIAFIELTDEGSKAIEAYLAELVQEGLAG